MTEKYWFDDAYRRVEGNYEVTLSNGWEVYCYGSLGTSCEDVYDADDDNSFFEVRIEDIGDENGNAVSYEEFSDELKNELNEKIYDILRREVDKV